MMSASSCACRDQDGSGPQVILTFKLLLRSHASATWRKAFCGPQAPYRRITPSRTWGRLTAVGDDGPWAIDPDGSRMVQLASNAAYKMRCMATSMLDLR